jgi:hypothetical protein
MVNRQFAIRLPQGYGGQVVNEKQTYSYTKSLTSYFLCSSGLHP